MQSLIRSKSAGVTGGRGTAGAGPGRDLLEDRSIRHENFAVKSTDFYRHRVMHCTHMRNICQVYTPGGGTHLSKHFKSGANTGKDF